MTLDLSPLMVPGVLEARLDGTDVVLFVSTEAQALQLLSAMVGYTLKDCRLVDGVQVTRDSTQPLRVVEVRLTATHKAQVDLR